MCTRGGRSHGAQERNLGITTLLSVLFILSTFVLKVWVEGEGFVTIESRP